MTDRRRTNAPPGGTTAPVFTSTPTAIETKSSRSRGPNDLRKIFLRTGLVPSASGSSYLELQPSIPQDNMTTFSSRTSSLKLTCTVHGPRPLPRTAPFSPNLLLSTHVKFAPFASKQRRGYLRDSAERDLGVHLETALRGIIIGERFPKSACEVVITVLEGEENAPTAGERKQSLGGVGMMNVLAGCITAASAAIVDAGIDCVDLVSGGVAASTFADDETAEKDISVLDPCPDEHDNLRAACVVGYLQSRDEVTELWMKGDAGADAESLIDRAVEAAVLSRTVLADAVKEGAEAKFGLSSTAGAADAVMTE
ncbi:hypothetical protein AAFC00_001388 [Neodothiora populina]|uniref:Exoribonuclease phosphorolytic domain-containing protein n=1 Tax=Neodothiora populina TaxID=2781224 RepID=A0ABR3PNQ7_9PEZI